MAKKKKGSLTKKQRLMAALGVLAGSGGLLILAVSLKKKAQAKTDEAAETYHTQMSLLQMESGRDALNEIILQASKLAPPPPPIDEERELPSKVVGNVRYRYIKHDVLDSQADVTALGANDSVIFPGAMIYGIDPETGFGIDDFAYRPIRLPRAPMTISISLATSKGVDVYAPEVVQNPSSLSEVQVAIQRMTSGAIGPQTRIAASATWVMEEVFSESQMGLVLGADVDTAGFNLKSAFNFKESSQKTRIVAKYTQKFYTIDVDEPADPAGFFAGGISIEDALAALPPGCAPVYVKSVVYGMIAVMTMESDASFNAMKTKVDSAFSGGYVDIKVKFDEEESRRVSESKINININGGSTRDLGSVLSGWNGFRRVIGSSASFGQDSVPAPIGYRFYNLDGGDLAKITLASQYTERIPIQIKTKYRISLDSIEVLSVDDSSSEIELCYLWFKVQAFNRKDRRDQGGALQTSRAKIGPASWAAGKNDGALVYYHSGSVIDLGAGAAYPRDAAGSHRWDPQVPLANSSQTITFDSEGYDLDDALVIVRARAIDKDTNCDTGFWGDADGATSRPMEITGTNFLENEGHHALEVNAAGMGKVRLNWSLEAIG